MRASAPTGAQALPGSGVNDLPLAGGSEADRRNDESRAGVPAGDPHAGWQATPNLAGPPTRERWWLHAFLLLCTFLTTTAGGVLLAGGGSLSLPAVLRGLSFSLPLLLILLCHEGGHFLVARRCGVSVSPPYFIPAPHAINLIGTFGAFIRLRSRVPDRRSLLNIGAAGPIASFVLSVPCFAAGMAWSRTIPLRPGAEAPYAVLFGGQAIGLGSSLSTELLSRFIGHTGGVLVLHPVAFAGWLGLFVTALNLLPLAQLDGGHILYALLGRRQRRISWGFMGLLLALGRWWWGWWLWAALVVVIGRGSLAHPPLPVEELKLGTRERLIGWGCILIFVLTFVPVPLRT